MEEKWDLILDFIEDHRLACIIGGIVVILLICGLGIRSCNLKKAEQERIIAEQQAALEAELEAQRLEEEAALANNEDDEPKSQYQVSLGLQAESDGRVEVVEEEPEPEPEPVVEVKTEPNFEVEYNIFDKTGVPKKNVDGSSCKAYLEKVSLKDFGTYWGTKLTEDDFNSPQRVLVGVDQDPNDFERGDLQSVGWVFENMDNLSDNTAIKFTNLHVIGKLSDSHVAVLCSYDWYSAFGLTDTLVVFEDTSDTLNVEDFEDGAIFSATVFKHNMKVAENVNGKRVLCVQYDVFK